MCPKIFFLSIKPGLVDSCEVDKKLSVIRKRYAGNNRKRDNMLENAMLQMRWQLASYTQLTLQ